jgi:hypothetical protein
MNSKRDKLKSKVLKVLAVHFDKFTPEFEERIFSQIYDCFYPIKDLTAQQKMVGALAKVMNGNTRLMGSRLGRFASALIKEGATPEKVLEKYDKGGWWWLSYWKGHDKGQYPNEADIRNTWDHWDAPVAQKGPTMDDLLKDGLR